MIPHEFNYETVTESKLAELEQTKKEKVLFTSFHDEVTKEDYATEIYQCDLLAEAIMKLDKLGISWEGHK